MQTVPIAIGVLILIFGVGYLVTKPDTNSVSQVTTITETNDKQSNSILVSEEAETTNEITPIETTGILNDTETDAAANIGSYQNYDAEKIAKSDAEHILLFFHATWCPSCKALDADIVANADTIPSGVEIYKLDYDIETALKRQYGITTQHSIIEIDSTGTAVSAITHPLRLNDVLATI